jgi:hypothetical protein
LLRRDVLESFALLLFEPLLLVLGLLFLEGLVLVDESPLVEALGGFGAVAKQFASIIYHLILL